MGCFHSTSAKNENFSKDSIEGSHSITPEQGSIKMNESYVNQANEPTLSEVHIANQSNQNNVANENGSTSISSNNNIHNVNDKQNESSTSSNNRNLDIFPSLSGVLREKNVIHPINSPINSPIVSNSIKKTELSPITINLLPSRQLITMQPIISILEEESDQSQEDKPKKHVFDQEDGYQVMHIGSFKKKSESPPSNGRRNSSQTTYNEVSQVSNFSNEISSLNEPRSDLNISKGNKSNLIYIQENNNSEVFPPKRRQSQQLYNDESSIIPLSQIKNISPTNQQSEETETSHNNFSIEQIQKHVNNTNNSSHFNSNLEEIPSLRTESQSPILRPTFRFDGDVSGNSKIVNSNPELATTPAFKQGKSLKQNKYDLPSIEDSSTTEGPITTQSAAITFFSPSKNTIPEIHSNTYSPTQKPLDSSSSIAISSRSSDQQNDTSAAETSHDLNDTPRTFLSHSESSPATKTPEDSKISKASSYNNIIDNSSDIPSHRSVFSEHDESHSTLNHELSSVSIVKPQINQAFDITEIISEDTVELSTAFESIRNDLLELDPIGKKWIPNSPETASSVNNPSQVDESIFKTNDDLIWLSKNTSSLADKIVRYKSDNLEEPDSARVNYEREHELTFEAEEEGLDYHFSPNNTPNSQFRFSKDDDVLMRSSDEESEMQGFRVSSEDEGFEMDNDSFDRGDDMDEDFVNL